MKPRIYEYEDHTMGDRNAPDAMDRASSEERLFAERALELQRARARAQYPRARQDGLCVDCEEPVEAGRLHLGLGRCLPCQLERERMRR